MTKILQYGDLRAHGIPYSRSQLWRLERAGNFRAGSGSVQNITDTSPLKSRPISRRA